MVAMTDRDKPTGKTLPRAAREKRLAEALRANLKRRKAPAKPSAPEALPTKAAPGPGKPSS